MNVSAQQVVQSQVDLSLVIAVAALLLSALSPLLSAIVRLIEKQMEIKAENARHRQQFYDQHRAEVIEAYVTAVGTVARSKDYSGVVAYGKAMGEIYLYADESLWPLLDSISEKITRNRPEDVSEELKVLCKELSHYDVRSKDQNVPDKHQKCAVCRVCPIQLFRIKKVAKTSHRREHNCHDNEPKD